jgi:hypothetical protein
MDPAAAETMYRVSQGQRALDLLGQPCLAVAGVAMVVYTIAHGWPAWLAAAPVVLVVKCVTELVRLEQAR